MLETLFDVVPSKGEQIIILAGTGALSAWAWITGHISVPVSALVALMIADYAAGLVGAAYNRELNFARGATGFCKKIIQLAVCWVSMLIDIGLGTDFVQGAVIGGYILNEAGSVLENLARTPAGRAAVPMQLLAVLEVLKDRRGGLERLANARRTS